MKTNKDLTTSEILHRLVVPIQTRGNLGKSTEAIARCEWMSQRGVLWKGYDLDAFNRTLSTIRKSWPNEFMPNWKEPFFNRSQFNAGNWKRPRPN